MASIAENLATVRAALARRAVECGRGQDAVRLIAVSKTKPSDAVVEALEAGQRAFGENYVQETATKWPALRERCPEAELHLVGPLQSNKARDAVRLFDVIQSVDRPSLVAALGKELDRAGRSPRIFVQVNTGEEPQKSGVLPRDADRFIADCRARGLPVVGLMCIPPVDQPPSPHFGLLAKIAARNELPGLSMGMSADFEAAIQMGATHVRIGTAIFGERRRLE